MEFQEWPDEWKVLKIPKIFPAGQNSPYATDKHKQCDQKEECHTRTNGEKQL
jgi:hypothetical protein